jgi:MerR family mercuric resistance operon transcriptional regulator
MPENSDAGMTIGRLAEQAGVHIETVRYYQHLGLMSMPARPAGSIRRYGPDAVHRLRFIKRAQELGFSLDEVKALLKLSIGEHCAETRTLAERKARLVEQKISDLRGIQAALNKLIRACGTGKKGHGCPIIESLSQDGRPKPGKDKQPNAPRGRRAKNRESRP